MRRSRSAVWLGLPLAFVLAACGTNQGGQASPAASASGGGGFGPSASASASASPSASASGVESASASAATSGSASATTGGQVTGDLAVWAMGNEGERLNVLADEFVKANAGATVDVTPIDWGIARDKLLTAIGGRQTPCVSQMGTDMMGEFVKTGALERVPDTIDKSRFFEGAWNTGVVDGTPYGVPWYVETRVLYYRTDIAEKAGITSPPATWDELKAAAKAMKEKGGAEWGISLGTKNWQEYLPFLWSNGGDVMTGEGQFALNTPEAVEALTFYDSFFEEELSPKAVPEGFDITPAFIQGTHPMFFSGPWHLGLISETGGDAIEGKWDVAPLPKKETGTSFVGGSNLVVYKDCENKEAAWAFVEYLTRPETQVAWYKEATVLPAVQAGWDDPALQQDENLEVFRQQLGDAKAQPALATWSEINTAINEQLERVTAGNEAPQAGADAMQQAAERFGTGQ